MTEASRSVLIELMTILGDYRDALVLVGGWVPYFLLSPRRRSGTAFRHVGSIDIDIAVDPSAITGARYATMCELLAQRNYHPAIDVKGDPIPNSYVRRVVHAVTKRPYDIRVDFLTHTDDVRGGQHRHLPIQDAFLARKTEGCDVAFHHNSTFTLEGSLPEGGRTSATIRMANVVGCIAMKGIVMGLRFKEKDAYDVFAVLNQYGSGPQDVADALRPHLADAGVQRGIAEIRKAFDTLEGTGPAWVAAFLGGNSEEDRALNRNAAFFAVQDVLKLLAPQPVPAILRGAVSWDTPWHDRHRMNARAGLQKMGFNACMEVRATLGERGRTWPHGELLTAARNANIKTFGWPIGVVMANAEHKPRPVSDGIQAEIASSDGPTYDFWALRRDGEYFLLKSLFEDSREKTRLFADTRIVRAAETFMFFARLYANLGVGPQVRIGVSIAHLGLQGRTLAMAGPRLLSRQPVASDDPEVVHLETTLHDLNSRIVEHVKAVVAPMLAMFDFFELDDQFYEVSVKTFVAGKL